MRSSTAALLVVTVLPSSPAPAETVSRTVGHVALTADLAHSFPGGVIVAGVSSRYRLGSVDVVLDGRRSPLYETGKGPRALVPVPVDRVPGPAVLGFEIASRTGRQRVPLDVSIVGRSYGSRSVGVLETRRHLVSLPSAVHDSRQLLELVRAETSRALWQGAFRPPVATPPDAASFGEQQTYVGIEPRLEYLTDGAFGEYHRGLDYGVPAGTVVQAPAAGTVIFAGYLTVPGNVVVLDHGQGLVSVLAHLSRLDVHEGESIEGRTPVGLSGDSGAASGASLDWRLYLHGIAVDPRVVMEMVD